MDKAANFHILGSWEEVRTHEDAHGLKMALARRPQPRLKTQVGVHKSARTTGRASGHPRFD